MFSKYEAIIFDLDGTLVDSMWIWEEIDIEFLARRDIEFPNDFQQEIEGMSFTETAEYFKQRFDLPESLDEIKAEWIEMAETIYREKVKLKEHVRKLLDHFTALEIPMGIGTSNSKDLAQATIDGNEIGKYFKTLRTSCEVHKGKPSPDIFLKVAEDLGVSPDKCLVFEDTFAGVQAGVAAGMDVIAIYDKISSASKEEIESIALRFIMSYEELL